MRVRRREEWPPMADAATGRARSAGEAVEARAYGLTQADLREWEPSFPIEIYWAVTHDVAPAAALRWAAEGLRICDAVRAIVLGMTPEEVAPWAKAGFAPLDAVEFIVGDTALLIRNGWTLDEAVTARYSGIAAEDWRPV
jgi:hypothetical protein